MLIKPLSSQACISLLLCFSSQLICYCLPLTTPPTTTPSPPIPPTALQPSLRKMASRNSPANPPSTRASPGNPLSEPSSFSDLISVFERIQMGQDTQDISSSLESLSIKYNIGDTGQKRSKKGHQNPNNPNDASRRRPKTTSSMARASRRGHPAPPKRSQNALNSQSAKQLPRLGSAATDFKLSPGLSVSAQSPINRPSTTASALRNTPFMSPDPDEPPDALDLFEVDAPPSPSASSSVSSTASPTVHSPPSGMQPPDQETQSPIPRPSRRRSQSDIPSGSSPLGSSPLPPIFQALNSTEDEFTSEFYGDVLNTDISSLYKTLETRARTVHGTRRASTGLIEVR